VIKSRRSDDQEQLLFLEGDPMMNYRILPSFLVLALALTGAKGNGCGVDVQPGDGGSASWDVGTLPVAKKPDLPMTCEWLESNNCWKQMVAEVQACAPKDVGVLNADRTVADFDGAAQMDFAGPLSTPGKDTETVVVTDHRFTSADSTACFTGKILDSGRVAYASKGKTIVSESKTLSTYRIICSDGSSYASDVTGTCADFGARYIAGAVPSYVLKCVGGSDCTSVAGGGPSGKSILVRFK
jgi:hypothetical protein